MWDNETEEEFKADCLKYYGPNVVLTGKARHWCRDWDFLPIDETCEEFKACTCFNRTRWWERSN
jgi:hypothetical protein